MSDSTNSDTSATPSSAVPPRQGSPLPFEPFHASPMRYNNSNDTAVTAKGHEGGASSISIPADHDRSTPTSTQQSVAPDDGRSHPNSFRDPMANEDRFHDSAQPQGLPSFVSTHAHPHTNMSVNANVHHPVTLTGSLHTPTNILLTRAGGGLRATTAEGNGGEGGGLSGLRETAAEVGSKRIGGEGGGAMGSTNSLHRLAGDGGGGGGSDAPPLSSSTAAAMTSFENDDEDDDDDDDEDKSDVSKNRFSKLFSTNASSIDFETVVLNDAPTFRRIEITNVTNKSRKLEGGDAVAPMASEDAAGGEGGGDGVEIVVAITSTVSCISFQLSNENIAVKEGRRSEKGISNGASPDSNFSRTHGSGSENERSVNANSSKGGGVDDDAEEEADYAYSNSVFDMVETIDKVTIPAGGTVAVLCAFRADPNILNHINAPLVAYNGLIQLTAKPTTPQTSKVSGQHYNKNTNTTNNNNNNVSQKLDPSSSGATPTTPFATSDVFPTTARNPTHQAITPATPRLQLLEQQTATLSFTSRVGQSIIAVTPNEINMIVGDRNTVSKEINITNRSQVKSTFVARLQTFVKAFRVDFQEYDRPEESCLGKRFVLQPLETRKLILSVTTSGTPTGEYFLTFQFDNLKDFRNQVLVSACVTVSSHLNTAALFSVDEPHLEFGDVYQHGHHTVSRQLTLTNINQKKMPVSVRLRQPPLCVSKGRVSMRLASSVAQEGSGARGGGGGGGGGGAGGRAAGTAISGKGSESNEEVIIPPDGEVGVVITYFPEEDEGEGGARGERGGGKRMSTTDLADVKKGNHSGVASLRSPLAGDILTRVKFYLDLVGTEIGLGYQRQGQHRSSASSTPASAQAPTQNVHIWSQVMLHHSMLTVSTNTVRFGDVYVSQFKTATFTVENISPLIGRIAVILHSKILSVDTIGSAPPIASTTTNGTVTTVLDVGPSSKLVVKLKLSPQRVNPEYRKQLIVRNLNAPHHPDFFINVEANNMAPEETQIHDAQYVIERLSTIQHPRILCRVPYVIPFRIRSRNATESIQLKLNSTTKEISVLGIKKKRDVRHTSSDDDDDEEEEEDEEAVDGGEGDQKDLKTTQNSHQTEQQLPLSPRPQSVFSPAATTQTQGDSSGDAIVASGVGRMPLTSSASTGDLSAIRTSSAPPLPLPQAQTFYYPPTADTDDEIRSFEFNARCIRSLCESTAFARGMAGGAEGCLPSAAVGIGGGGGGGVSGNGSGGPLTDQSQADAAGRGGSNKLDAAGRGGSNKLDAANSSATDAANASNNKLVGAADENSAGKGVVSKANAAAAEGGSGAGGGSSSRADGEPHDDDDAYTLPEGVTMKQLSALCASLGAFITSRTEAIDTLILAPLQTRIVYVAFNRVVSCPSWASKEDCLSIDMKGTPNPRIVRLSYRLCETRFDIGQKSRSFGDVDLGDRKTMKITIRNPCEAPLWFSIEKHTSVASLRIGAVPLKGHYYDFVKGSAVKDIDITIGFGLRGAFRETLTITNLLDPTNVMQLQLKAEVRKVEQFEVNPESVALEATLPTPLLLLAAAKKKEANDGEGEKAAGAEPLTPTTVAIADGLEAAISTTTRVTTESEVAASPPPSAAAPPPASSGSTTSSSANASSAVTTIRCACKVTVTNTSKARRSICVTLSNQSLDSLLNFYQPFTAPLPPLVSSSVASGDPLSLTHKNLFLSSPTEDFSSTVNAAGNANKANSYYVNLLSVEMQVEVDETGKRGTATKSIEERIEALQQKLKIAQRKGKTEKIALVTKNIEKLKAALNGTSVAATDDSNDADLVSEDEGQGGGEQQQQRTSQTINHRELAQQLRESGVFLPSLAPLEQASMLISLVCRVKSTQQQDQILERLQQHVSSALSITPATIGGNSATSSLGQSVLATTPSSFLNIAASAPSAMFASVTRNGTLVFSETKDAETFKTVPIAITLHNLCHPVNFLGGGSAAALLMSSSTPLPVGISPALGSTPVAVALPSSAAANAVNTDATPSATPKPTSGGGGEVGGVSSTPAAVTAKMGESPIPSTGTTATAFLSNVAAANESKPIAPPAAPPPAPSVTPPLLQLTPETAERLVSFLGIPTIVIHNSVVNEAAFFKLQLTALHSNTTCVFMSPCQRCGGVAPNSVNARIRCLPSSLSVPMWDAAAASVVGHSRADGPSSATVTLEVTPKSVGPQRYFLQFKNAGNSADSLHIALALNPLPSTAITVELPDVIGGPLANTNVPVSNDAEGRVLDLGTIVTPLLPSTVYALSNFSGVGTTNSLVPVSPTSLSKAASSLTAEMSSSPSALTVSPPSALSLSPSSSQLSGIVTRSIIVRNSSAYPQGVCIYSNRPTQLLLALDPSFQHRLGGHVLRLEPRGGIKVYARFVPTIGGPTPATTKTRRLMCGIIVEAVEVGDVLLSTAAPIVTGASSSSSSGSSAESGAQLQSQVSGLALPTVSATVTQSILIRCTAAIGRCLLSVEEKKAAGIDLGIIKAPPNAASGAFLLGGGRGESNTKQLLQQQQQLSTFFNIFNSSDLLPLTFRIDLGGPNSSLSLEPAGTTLTQTIHSSNSTSGGKRITIAVKPKALGGYIREMVTLHNLTADQPPIRIPIFGFRDDGTLSVDTDALLLPTVPIHFPSSVEEEGSAALTNTAEASFSITNNTVKELALVCKVPIPIHITSSAVAQDSSGGGKGKGGGASIASAASSAQQNSRRSNANALIGINDSLVAASGGGGGSNSMASGGYVRLESKQQKRLHCELFGCPSFTPAEVAQLHRHELVTRSGVIEVELAAIVGGGASTAASMMMAPRCLSIIKFISTYGLSEGVVENPRIDIGRFGNAQSSKTKISVRIRNKSPILPLTLNAVHSRLIRMSDKSLTIPPNSSAEVEGTVNIQQCTQGPFTETIYFNNEANPENDMSVTVVGKFYASLWRISHDNKELKMANDTRESIALQTVEIDPTAMTQDALLSEARVRISSWEGGVTAMVVVAQNSDVENLLVPLLLNSDATPLIDNALSFEGVSDSHSLRLRCIIPSQCPSDWLSQLATRFFGKRIKFNASPASVDKEVSDLARFKTSPSSLLWVANVHITDALTDVADDISVYTRLSPLQTFAVVGSTSFSSSSQKPSARRGDGTAAAVGVDGTASGTTSNADARSTGPSSTAGGSGGDDASFVSHLKLQLSQQGKKSSTYTAHFTLVNSTVATTRGGSHQAKLQIAPIVSPNVASLASVTVGHVTVGALGPGETSNLISVAVTALRGAESSVEGSIAILIYDEAAPSSLHVLRLSVPAEVDDDILSGGNANNASNANGAGASSAALVGVDASAAGPNVSARDARSLAALDLKGCKEVAGEDAFTVLLQGSASRSTKNGATTTPLEFKVHNRVQSYPLDYSVTILSTYPSPWLTLGERYGNSAVHRLEPLETHTVTLWANTSEVGTFEAHLIVSNLTETSEIYFMRVAFEVFSANVGGSSGAGGGQLFAVMCPSRGGGKMQSSGPNGIVHLNLRTFVAPFVIESKYFEIHSMSSNPLEFQIISPKTCHIRPERLTGLVNPKLTFGDRTTTVLNVSVAPKSKAVINLVLALDTTIANAEPGARVEIEIDVIVRCKVLRDSQSTVRVVFRATPQSFEVPETRLVFDRYTATDATVHLINKLDWPNDYVAISDSRLFKLVGVLPSGSGSHSRPVDRPLQSLSSAFSSTSTRIQAAAHGRADVYFSLNQDAPEVKLSPDQLAGVMQSQALLPTMEQLVQLLPPTPAGGGPVSVPATITGMSVVAGGGSVVPLPPSAFNNTRLPQDLLFGLSAAAINAILAVVASSSSASSSLNPTPQQPIMGSASSVSVPHSVTVSVEERAFVYLKSDPRERVMVQLIYEVTLDLRGISLAVNGGESPRKNILFEGGGGDANANPMNPLTPSALGSAAAANRALAASSSQPSAFTLALLSGPAGTAAQQASARLGVVGSRILFSPEHVQKRVRDFIRSIIKAFTVDEKLLIDAIERLVDDDEWVLMRRVGAAQPVVGGAVVSQQQQQQLQQKASLPTSMIPNISVSQPLPSSGESSPAMGRQNSLTLQQLGQRQEEGVGSGGNALDMSGTYSNAMLSAAANDSSTAASTPGGGSSPAPTNTQRGVDAANTPAAAADVAAAAATPSSGAEKGRSPFTAASEGTPSTHLPQPEQQQQQQQQPSSSSASAFESFAREERLMFEMCHIVDDLMYLIHHKELRATGGVGLGAVVGSGGMNTQNTIASPLTAATNSAAASGVNAAGTAASGSGVSSSNAPASISGPTGPTAAQTSSTHLLISPNGGGGIVRMWLTLAQMLNTSVMDSKVMRTFVERKLWDCPKLPAPILKHFAICGEKLREIIVHCERVLHATSSSSSPTMGNHSSSGGGGGGQQQLSSSNVSSASQPPSGGGMSSNSGGGAYSSQHRGGGMGHTMTSSSFAGAGVGGMGAANGSFLNVPQQQGGTATPFHASYPLAQTPLTTSAMSPQPSAVSLGASVVSSGAVPATPLLTAPTTIPTVTFTSI